MFDYLIINNDGKVVGKSAIEGQNKIKIPIKPFQKGVFWNGEKLVYNFSVVERKSTEKLGLFKTIALIKMAITKNVFWHNGTETREHNGNISVLIPCYNQSKYVRTAVKSCLKQTQKPKAVVILLMDNDSYSLKDELERMSDIVKCYCEPQMNVCKARTYLAEKCKTDWLVFLDADDFILRDYIEKLDKSTAPVVCSSHIGMSKNIMFLTDTNKRAEENTATQNMTCLMHKDVFFDIGLKEKYSIGGEDFDFWLTLWEKKKWKIDYIPNVYYIYVLKSLKYFDGISLSHTKEFYTNLFECLKDHKKLLLQGIETSPFVEEKLKEKWFLENLSEESLHKIAIDFNEKNNDVESELSFFVDYIRNEFDYYSALSCVKDTDHIYNKSDYVFVNCDPNCIDKIEIENCCFDAIFLDLGCSDIEKLVVEQKQMIVRKELWELIKNYSPIDQVFYLLKNHSCFIKSNKDNVDKKLFTRNNDFINALPNITFDNTIKASAKILFDYYCEGMFTSSRTACNVSFILHKVCNMDCPYCFQKGEHKQIISDEEMYNNFDKALTYFENLVAKDKSRVLKVQILGGEPTIWSEWLQNKVLERLKNYNYFTLFTNGANKDSPLYKSMKSLKRLHIIDWKTELQKNIYYSVNEYPLVVIQEKDKDSYKKIFTEYKGSPLYLSLCKSPKQSENVSFDFMKELSQIANKNIDTVTVKSYVEAVNKKGLRKVKEECRTSVHSVGEKFIQIDCATLRVQPCCNAIKTYPLEEFDFTKKADYEIDCKNCNYIY